MGNGSNGRRRNQKNENFVVHDSSRSRFIYGRASIRFQGPPPPKRNHSQRLQRVILLHVVNGDFDERKLWTPFKQYMQFSGPAVILNQRRLEGLEAATGVCGRLSPICLVTFGATFNQKSIQNAAEPKPWRGRPRKSQARSRSIESTDQGKYLCYHSITTGQPASKWVNPLNERITH